MTKRLPPLVVRVRRAWGPGAASMDTGHGPFYDPVVSGFEQIIHELCHATFLGVPVKYYSAQRGRVSECISSSLSTRRRYRQELHEVRTLAAELLVLKVLRAELSIFGIFRLGSEAVRLLPPKRLVRCLRRALKTQQVRDAAAAVVAFIRREVPVLEPTRTTWKTFSDL